MAGTPLFAYAHTGIVSSPATSCGSIDSTDLATHTGNQIDNRINTVASTTGLSLFTSRQTSTSTPWTRNPSVWTSAGTPLDFTGVAGWNNQSGAIQYQQGATLISPRHFIAAGHFAIAVGSTTGFIDSSGNHVERVVVGSTNITGTDIQVEVLDSDVPDSITYYPIMASSTLFALFQKIQGETLDVPIVAFDQEAKALIHKMTSISSTYITHAEYSTSTRKEFNERLIGGDSGQPSFLIVDNQPVLLFAHYFDTYSPNLGNYISQINTAMTSLGGWYQVTEYNPTCFRQYALNHYPVWPGGLSGVISAYEATTTLPVQLFDFTATDPDGDALSYRFYMNSLIASGFSTSSSSGILTYSSNLNFETVQTQADYDALMVYTENDPDHIFADEAAKEVYRNQFSQYVDNVITAYAIDITEFPSEKYLSKWFRFYNIEEPPVFGAAPYTFSIAENSGAGSSVGSVSATDQDYDETISYSISSGNDLGAFAINSTTGAVTVASAYPLDYESRHSIVLTITASSTDNARIPNLFDSINYATTMVTVNITDVSESSGGGGGSSGGGGGGGGGGSSDGIIYYNRPAQATTSSATAAALTAGRIVVINGVSYVMAPIQSTAGSAASAASITTQARSLYKNLSLGSSNQDVRVLQQFLNARGFTVSDTGAGSPGNEVSYFGLKTKQALIKFQKANNIKPASGLFGPVTRAAIKGL